MDIPGWASAVVPAASGLAIGSWLAVAITATAGLVIGSWLAVVIARRPRAFSRF